MLIGSLELDGAPAKKSLGDLEAQFDKAVGGLSKLVNSAMTGVAAFASFNVVLHGFRNALDLGGTLNDLSMQTGETVGNLVILRAAFDNAGLGAGSVGEVMLKLQDSIAGVNEEGKSTAGALQALGLRGEELRSMGSLEQIEALQKGFAGIADQAQRVQVARDLLGKSGGKALALLGDPEALEQARKQAGPLAEIMQKNVVAFDKLGDVLNGLKLNAFEFFAGALEVIAPKATHIADALASIDFRGYGRGAGQFVNVLLELGKVLVGLGPIIQKVGDALGNMNAGTIQGAGMGALMGKGLAGRAAGAVVGGGVGSVLGGDHAGAAMIGAMIVRSLGPLMTARGGAMLGRVGGPVGMAVGGGIGYLLSKMFSEPGKKPEAVNHLGETFKGLGPHAPFMTAGRGMEAPVSALQRIGGGGGGGGGFDAMNEYRTHTRILTDISNGIKGLSSMNKSGSKLDPPPV
jgi:hypothetical protein